jgi:hypothetical protein
MAGDARYYIMASECPSGAMLLDDIRAVGPGGGQEWVEGRPFPQPPTTPVRIQISTDYEDAEHVLDWADAPPVMSNRLYEALLALGIDNMQAFDAYIESEDGTRRIEGYKAVNVIGLVSLASSETRFSPEYPSRTIDTHIDEMNPDNERARGLDLFRLAESIGQLVVSARVKSHLEKYQFPYLVFRPLEDLVT